jgi:hypothetical protein
MFQGEVPPVYHRKTEEIEKCAKKLSFPGWRESFYNQEVDLTKGKRLSDFYVIGFAGKLYPYVTYSKPSEKINSYTTIEKNIFDPEELDQLVKKYTKPDKVYKYFNRDNSTYVNTFDILTKHKELLSFFEEYKTPIFHCKFDDNYWKPTYTLTINPQLKQYGFASMLDPYTAIQELHMYLNNVMVQDTQVEVPVGSDEVIRDCKGFYEYSFKNLPGKKKRKNG